MGNRSANVTSLEALDWFAVVLRKFREEASIALDELEMEIHRAVEWIQHERKHYWSDQVRRGFQQVAEARIALERKRMFPIGDQKPSCYDEKKALDLAKRRLALAQRKVETVRHWSRALPQAVMEYKGDVNPLVQWLTVELPAAIAALERMGDALETYVGMEPMEMQAPAGTESEADGSAARPGTPPQPVSAEEPPPATERSPNDETVGPDDRGGPAGTGDGSAPQSET